MVFNVVSGYLKEGDNIKDEPIPSDVIEICEKSFEKSKQTLQKLTFSGTLLQVIRKSAFIECLYLTEVDLSNCYQCTKIEDFAFEFCCNLSVLKLPSSIRSIGNNAFRDCAITYTIDLTNIYCLTNSFLGNPMSFTTLDSSQYFRMYENNIYNTEYTTIVFVSYSTETLKLHPDTTCIGSCSFSTCSLKEVILPPQITQISGCAFHHTLNLEHLTISPSVKTIIKDSIVTNPKLISLTISEGVEKIEESAITNSPQLKYIKIPETLTNIAKNAFSVPKNLKYVKYKKVQFASLIEGGIPRRALVGITYIYNRSSFNEKLILMMILITK